MTFAAKPLDWRSSALRWTDSFAQRLADHEGVLWSYAQPATHKNPRLVGVSRAGARLIGLSADTLWGDREAAAAVLSGNEPLFRGMPRPWAQCYGGHQFGAWAGQLGDGRAINLGEAVSNGRSWEVQLKGAGRTQYSRFGDGLAVRRSSIREYLAAENMHALGIPSSRSLSLVFTDTEVQREEPELGAVVARLAPSWVRFGSFELPASRGDHAACQRLADYVLAHSFPHIAGASAAARYTQLFREVTLRTARTVAQWQAVGFCHGVMNTDNMSVLGLTIDYGPFAFMDAYDPQFVCNASDYAGRYAFAEQPRVALWNLLRLATPFAKLIDCADTVAEILSAYAGEYRRTYAALMCHKLGLYNVAKETDHEAVIEPLLALMERVGADYTLTMRTLCDVPELLARNAESEAIDKIVDRIMAVAESGSNDTAWKEEMRAFLTDVYRPRLLDDANGALSPEDARDIAARMRRTNPRFVLRNWVAQDVIGRAAGGDEGSVDRVLDLITTYAFCDALPDHLKSEVAYGGPVPKWGQGLQSSCSS
ncbi:hypothetical protein H4S06_000377 [Coemansia sp. BCRC 34490]|nr:hypothetical protein H4S06_000377 [Coemansia sp. BCRC 34490]